MKAGPDLAKEIRNSRVFRDSPVHAWREALERRVSDPKGAIPAAKTLLERVCKQSQYTETIFRSILGNCQSIVDNLKTPAPTLGKKQVPSDLVQRHYSL